MVPGGGHRTLMNFTPYPYAYYSSYESNSLSAAGLADGARPWRHDCPCARRHRQRNLRSHRRDKRRVSNPGHVLRTGGLSGASRLLRAGLLPDGDYRSGGGLRTISPKLSGLDRDRHRRTRRNLYLLESSDYDLQDFIGCHIQQPVVRETVIEGNRDDEMLLAMCASVGDRIEALRVFN